MPAAAAAAAVSTPRLSQGNSAGQQRLFRVGRPGVSQPNRHWPQAANLLPFLTDSPRHAAGRAAALGPPPRCELQARPTRPSTAIERPAPWLGPRPLVPHARGAARSRRPADSLRVHHLPQVSAPTPVVSTPFAPAVKIAPSESVPLGSQAVSHTSVPRRALSVPDCAIGWPRAIRISSPWLSGPSATRHPTRAGG